MPRPGPIRGFYGFKLSDDEIRPVLDLAKRLDPERPNLTAAIRQIIAEWAAGKGRTDLEKN